MGSPRIAILGGGLSAAFAYRACVDNNITPTVITERIFTPPGGCVWVHDLPKSVKDRKLFEEITVEATGSARTYAEKMWGRDLKTSWPEKDFKTKGVAPIKAAKVLWGEKAKLVPNLRKAKVTPELIKSLRLVNDLVIQTFPLGTAKPEWETPIWVMPADTRGNLVLYMGDNNEPYVRYSCLFGMKSFEFPAQRAGLGTSMMAWEWGIQQEIIDSGYGIRKGSAIWYAPEIAPDAVTGKIAVENYADRNVLYAGRWASGNRKFLSDEVYGRVVWHLEREKLIP